MNKRHLMILSVICALSVYCIIQFSASLNPYVSFAEAKSLQSTVQVKGTLYKDANSIAYEAKQLKFYLLDEFANKIQITYYGIKPDNFEHAESIVAIGKYTNDIFVAEKLLVKCPSKYERKGERP